MRWLLKLGPIKWEVERYQRQLDRLQTKLKHLIEPFEKELLESYKEYIQLEVTKGANGKFYIIPEQPDQILEEGTYTFIYSRRK